MKAKLISTLLEDTVDINTIEEMSSIAETESRLFTQYFDPALAAVLRPHQLEAVKFLLPRLLGEEISQPIELDENYLPPQQSRDSGIPLTGAVLADDMGTGKTLTALAVLWCLCRHGKGKGVIICPSSLVDNWRAEVKKWFPKNLDRSALYINGSNRSSGVKGTDSIVDLFASSHPSMRPLLVLSYDMFRIYSDVLNEITTFNTVICDEGHKIKNALGTKTTLALGNCCAMQRLVLTGTPIQNNLNELFAVVQFAAPGYLGDLKEFQTRYAVPIMKNPTSNAAKQAKNQLRLALRRILLRRDRDAILKSVLPPRVVTGVVCRLSDAQREAYLAECAVLTNERALENSSNLVDEETALPLTKKARTLEGSGPRGHETLMVLSKLLMLRQVCSVPPPIGTAPEGANVDSYLRMTVKLRVLDALLSELRANRPTERVVIVSNFITSLDAIHMLARARRYLSLRLDGDVAAEKRQNIVNHFNNPKEPFFLMLLSAKAGGVGLNLIGKSVSDAKQCLLNCVDETGATRLVLWEPDWNPSTDEQAMGRVWRDGQTKNVFIYRFIAGDTIEETIIERQSEKNELHSVIKDTPDDKSDTVVRARAIDEAAQEGVPVSNLQRMILPRGFLEDFPSSSSGYDEQSFESKGSHQDDVFHALTAPVSAICRDLCFLKDMS